MSDYTLEPFHGLTILAPDPVGDGGLAINENFKALATRIKGGPPNDEDADRASVVSGTRWIDTTSETEWICTNPGSIDEPLQSSTWLQLSAGGVNAYTKEEVDDFLEKMLPLSGGTMTGSIVATTIDATELSTQALEASGSIIVGESPDQVEITGGDIDADGTITASALVLTPTWNTSSTFVAIGTNVTDLSSNAGSLLLDLQVSGSSKFKVAKDGTTTVGTAITMQPGGNLYVTNLSAYGFTTPNNNTTLTLNNRNFSNANLTQVQVNSTGVASNSNGYYRCFSLNANYNQTGTASGTDLLIARTRATPTTGFGSGQQLFIDAQIDGSSKFKVEFRGNILSEGSTLRLATSRSTYGNGDEMAGTIGDLYSDDLYLYRRCTSGVKRIPWQAFGGSEEPGQGQQQEGGQQ